MNYESLAYLPESGTSVQWICKCFISCKCTHRHIPFADVCMGGVMMPFWKWSANWISTMLGPYRHVLPIFLTTHSSSFSLNPLKLILILWPLLLPTVVYIMVGQLSYHLLIFTASSTFISYLSPLKRRYISMHQHLFDSSSFVLWWSTNIVPGISFLSPLR